MDSRSHDDFFPPERSVRDEAFAATETVSAAGEPAHDEASGRGDLHDAIDDLELELASLLTPDLEAIDVETVELEASDLDGLDLDRLDVAAEPGAVEPGASERAAPGAEATGQDAQEFDAAGRPESGPAAAAPAIAVLPAAEPAFVLPPETAEAGVDADGEAASAEAFVADRLIETIELELSLDDADGTIAPEAEAAETPVIAAESGTVVAEAWSGVAEGSGETVVVAAATLAVARDEVLQAGDESAAGVATADPEAGDPVAEAAPAEEPLDASLDAPLDAPLGPVAEAAAPADAEHEMPVEVAAAAAPEAGAGPAEDVEPALPVIAEAPASDVAPAAEATGDGSGASAVEAGAAAEADAAEDGGTDIVLPAAIMVAPQPEGAEATGARFEEALGAQDIPAAGFEAAVRKAAAQAAGRFLFQMPVHTVHDCQRVAAVNLAGDEAPTTMLVLLAGDGRSFRLEDARASDNPFAGMAVSYGGLLAHLKSLPPRAAA
ncbi:hypothetical protein [Aquibium microcysteis]|uniref:hypothetical protein n=1 Tax=Aquibium microcysteis TaxID=675281 RepID=UPI00165CFDA3|nr:hypothetical protein [Aquibium microcysteis]